MNYESELYSGFIKNMFHYLKRQVKKKITYKRDIEYGKRLIVSSSDNKALKKNNLNKLTIVKRKKGVFNPNKFIYFKDDIARYQINTFIMKYRHPEMKIEVRLLILAEKLFPKLPR